MSWQSVDAEASERAPAGERLALVGLTVPWALVSLILPAPQSWASLSLVAALAALILLGTIWSRERARQLHLDPETWALSAVLTLGYSMALLVAPASDGSVRHALCHECGTLSDADASFCYRCGSLGS